MKSVMIENTRPVPDPVDAPRHECSTIRPTRTTIKNIMLNRLSLAFAALIAMTSAAWLQAATITVEFSGPESDPAPFQEVTVLLIGEGQQSIEEATRFTSTEASFKKTFDVEKGEYHVLVFTGTWERVNDANKPGAFRSRKTVEVAAGDSAETVAVTFQPVDLKGVVGVDSGSGTVTDPNGKAVSGFKLQLATMIPSAGLYSVDEVVSESDGKFSSNKLVAGQQYILLDSDKNPVGELAVGSPVDITLAPRIGDTAPDVRFIHLASGKIKRVAQFKGKVVVIDFWASWCGPCQGPMAKMQKYREEHPEWGDRVELIALSIDNTKKAAVDHLESRAWDKTYNAWAGDGGFNAEAPKAYAVEGIPQLFVIDQAGKIVASGHPTGIDVSGTINELLAAAEVTTAAE